MNITIYPHHSPAGIIELVEKLEYDGLNFNFNAVSAERDTFETQRNVARNQLSRICEEGFNNDDTIGLEPADDYILRKLAELKQAANQQLQDAVKRMEAISREELWSIYSGCDSPMAYDCINAVRARLIQAVKGDS